MKAEQLIDQYLGEASIPTEVLSFAKLVRGDVSSQLGKFYVEVKGTPSDTLTGMGYEYAIRTVLVYDPSQNILKVFPGFESEAKKAFAAFNPTLVKRSTSAGFPHVYRVSAGKVIR